MNFSTFPHTHARTHAHMEPTLASAKATTTVTVTLVCCCCCCVAVLVGLKQKTWSSNLFALRGCCDCAHVAATQLLRRPHTADRGANVVVAFAVAAAAAARVVSICFLGARFAGVFVVVSLAVATVRPHSNRTWCRELGGGVALYHTISYISGIEA